MRRFTTQYQQVLGGPQRLDLRMHKGLLHVLSQDAKHANGGERVELLIEAPSHANDK